MSKKVVARILAIVLAASVLTGCENENILQEFESQKESQEDNGVISELIGYAAANVIKNVVESALVPDDEASQDATEDIQTSQTQSGNIENLDFATDIPDYSGELVYVVNNNQPFFTDEELEEAKASYEFYSELDAYGRCGYAMASVSEETMPTEERGDISSIHPTGWWGMKESSIGPERCHLIAFMLTGENANEKNLVTGTHTMNVKGMLPYESMVDDQVEDNGGHVLYRVTPDFRGTDDLCKGILLEAESVEDNGQALAFCVYIYNVEDGWDIDYSTATAEYIGEDTIVIDDTAYGDFNE